MWTQSNTWSQTLLGETLASVEKEEFSVRRSYHIQQKQGLYLLQTSNREKRSKRHIHL